MATALQRAGCVAAAGVVTVAVIVACTDHGDATLAAEHVTLSDVSALGTPAQPIMITEDEYSLRIGVTDLHPGTYTFTLHNVGAMAHDVNVDGPHIDDATTGYIDPGGSSTMTLRLSPGTYRVYCSVTGHEALGMHTTITVRPRAAKESR